MKLISLNIERDRHYGTVLPFLRYERPDVVCLQELLDRDIGRFEKELGMRALYAPIMRADRGRGTGPLAKAGVNSGTALFSRLPVLEQGSFYYFGRAGRVPKKTDPVSPGRHENTNGVFLYARVEEGRETFTIGTTHFTWTPDGRASEGQRRDMRVLLRKLRAFPDIVFCGDFNAPRGGEMWGALAVGYIDHIPKEYATSIDQTLHRERGVTAMVDGLFSTPHYRARGTRLACGVSDHCAVVSTIERIVTK